MKETVFVVRVSRLFLLMIFVVGALFLVVGLDFAFLHYVFDTTVGRGGSVGPLVFAVFAIAIGLLIVVTQGAYLILPPVMLRVTADEVTFGTGLRYKQKAIPTEYLESVNVFRRESMFEVDGKRKEVDGGIELVFSANGAVPASMATSAGITYNNRCLRLHKTYMNRRVQKSVAAIEAVIR